MIHAWVAGLCCLAIFEVALFAWNVRMNRREQRMMDDVREFMRRFPDRCMVCSFHRYGVQYGLERPDSQPDPHRCAEDAAPPEPTEGEG